MEHDTPPTTHDHDQFDKSYKIMLYFVLFSFAVAVAAVFFLCRRRRRQDHPGGVGSTTRGVDLSALNHSLPIFAYSSATHDPVLECAVCLSRFQNDEPGRVLPRCDHAFHVDCIDAWLHSHLSCPLCRVPVQTGVVVPVREPGRAKLEAGCSSEPSFSLVMGVALLLV